MTGNSIKKISVLLRIIAASVPFFPDYKKLAALTDVGDQRTLKTYLKYLEDCCLLTGLSRTGKGLRNLEKPEWKEDLAGKYPFGSLGCYTDLS